MLRSGLTMFFASALLALLPSVARTIGDSPAGYGILLGCFGAGAVLGALTMQPARARWSEDAVVSAGITILGTMTVLAGLLHTMVALAATMLVAG
jgi:transmembrane secretion effector